jgi:L-threonylcarbamoyladenylate synthase
MRVLSPDELDVAIAALRSDAPVGMPTETVYGLAARATSPAAVARVFEAKGRPADDPLIVHVSPALLGNDQVAGLQRLGLVGPTVAVGTLAKLLGCWPGPLTLVLPRGHAVPDAVTSGLDTVAVRMPAHPVAQALITGAGPLVAPSANRFGRISPTTADAVVAELSGRVGHVVDGGPCTVGVESTVLRVHDDGHTTLLRPGRIDRARLTALLGEAPGAPTVVVGPQRAPGQLASHYAPTTPLALVDRWEDVPWDRVHARGRVALLGWRTLPAVDAPGEVLSATGGLAEAAQRLFGCLRRLDALGVDLIVAERCPVETGLGEALRDRMKRAADGTEPI